MQVCIMGSEWNIVFKDMDGSDYDGLTDNSSKTIYIKSKNDERDAELKIDDFKLYQQRVIRHELIHAFLFECGLSSSMIHQEFGHDEQMIDWFAMIYPKYKVACESLGI